MGQTTLNPNLPALSSELLSFAAEHGLADWVPPVLEMTRRIFPQGQLTVHLESDQEVSGYRQIVVEIDASGMDEGQLLAAQNRWSDELFQICPATHGLNFRLSYA